MKHVFIGLCLIVFAKADGCKQKFADAHYREFGCSPEYDQDGCLKRYDCKEALKLLGDPKKCYFQGKQYNIGEKIDDELTENNCITSAHCVKDTGRDFIYAHIDCAEFYGLPKMQEGCFRQYKPDSCCSSATVCPPFPEDFATCNVRDKTFREGARFYPEDDNCLQCICKYAYSPEKNQRFCKPVNCGLGLLKSIEFQKGNIPIYLEKKLCCPIAWVEYNSDKFKNFGKKLEGVADPMSCIFGDRVFGKGEKFQVEKDTPFTHEINCECQLPPRLTCFQKPDPEPFGVRFQ